MEKLYFFYEYPIATKKKTAHNSILVLQERHSVEDSFKFEKEQQTETVIKYIFDE